MVRTPRPGHDRTRPTAAEGHGRPLEHPRPGAAPPADPHDHGPQVRRAARGRAALRASTATAGCSSARTGARTHHPAWSGNLLADPRATVTVDGVTTAVVASLADDDERARLLPALLAVWPGYDDYAARAGRELRVFRLAPPDASGRSRRRRRTVRHHLCASSASTVPRVTVSSPRPADPDRRRGRLRAFTPADVPVVREAALDPLIPLITSVPARGDDDACLAYVARQGDRLTHGVGYSFAVADLATDEAVGQIGLWLHDLRHGRVSTGYWVARPHRGRGLAADALVALTRWAVGLRERRAGRALRRAVRTGASRRTAENAGFVGGGSAAVLADGSATSGGTWSCTRSSLRRTEPDAGEASVTAVVRDLVLRRAIVRRMLESANVATVREADTARRHRYRLVTRGWAAHGPVRRNIARSSTVKRAALFLVAAALTTTLAACSSGDDTSGDSTASSSSTASSTAKPTADAGSTAAPAEANIALACGRYYNGGASSLKVRIAAVAPAMDAQDAGTPLDEDTTTELRRDRLVPRPGRQGRARAAGRGVHRDPGPHPGRPGRRRVRRHQRRHARPAGAGRHDQHGVRRGRLPRQLTPSRRVRDERS